MFDELCLVNESESLHVTCERQHCANGEKKNGSQIILAVQKHRENVRVASRSRKKHSASFVRREMEIKATMGHPFIPTRLAVITESFIEANNKRK